MTCIHEMFNMYYFGKNIIVFDRQDMQLLDSISIRDSRESIAFPLASAEGEAEFPYFQRLIKYAKNLGINQV